MQAIYDLKSGIFILYHVSEGEYDDTETQISLYLGHDDIGFVTNYAQKIMDGESAIMSDFSNPYLFVLYSKNEKKLLITQHPYGTPCFVYYVCKNDKIFFATSLQEIKELVTMPFLLNKKVLPQFLKNGFISGTETLIGEVMKIPAGVNLIVTTEGIKYTNIQWYDKKQLCKDLDSAYRTAIEAAVARGSKSDEDTIAITLSGGFDSNSNLFYVRKCNPNKKIQAFSIGGSIGANETIIAEKIASYYSNVEFCSSIVDSHMLDLMDDIVFRLEGMVFERGIFLQYALANLLQKHGCKQVVLGECSDEVFNQMTYSDEFQSILFRVGNKPFEAGANIVLMKSIHMLRSFGIEGRYPFLNSKVLQMAYQLRELNGESKKFHKSQCLQTLPEEVAKLIAWRGGTTDTEALFNRDFDVLQAIRNSKYGGVNYTPYPPFFSIHNLKKIRRIFRFGIKTEQMKTQEEMRRYYLALLFVESFEKQFCDKEY